MKDSEEPEGFYIQLQQLYPDEFVAVRDGVAVAHARTDGDLAEAVRRLDIDRASVTFMHVRSPRSVCVYRFPAR